MTTTPPKTAIICTTQGNMLDVIRQVLKKMAFTEIAAVSSGENCMAKLALDEEAVLILDWGIGEAQAVEILQSVQASHRSGIRPSFLFSRAQVEGLEGVAVEYGVMQIHMGEMSRVTIEERIEKLLNTQLYSRELRDALNALVDNRSRGDQKGVRKVLFNLYDKHPEDPFVVGEYAEDLLQSDEIDSALAIVQPFCSGDKKNPRLLNIIGRCLMKQSKFEEATVYLQQADLINPYNIKRLLRLGEAYLQIDNPNRAKANFDRALKLDPNNKDAKAGMGQTLLIMGDVNEALVFLRQLSGDAEMASVFNMAAIVSIRNGRFNDGMDLYRTACRTVGANNRPILAKLGFNMGLAAFKNKLNDRAYYYFNLAAKLDKLNERAKMAVAALRKLLGAETPDPTASISDHLDGLLKEDWEVDDLAGQELTLRGKAQDYDMEF